jgi:hypothetical protein
MVGSDRNAGAPDARPRRVLAAFVLGAVLSVGGLAAFVASGAAARGAFVNPLQAISSDEVARQFPSQPTYSFVPAESRASAHWDQEDEAPRHSHHHEQIRIISGHTHANLTVRSYYGLQQPVCVRLCDGFFFPLTAAAYDTGSQTAACQSLCPDAPTEVYYRNGSDNIEDAVSAKGQRYTALPVSLRYRSTADNTCSCHRDVATYAPMRDLTLRRGDAVMTPAGFMVFHGAEGAQHGAGDFSALANASIPASQRGALQALERISVAPRHQSLRDWLVSQSAPAARKTAAASRPAAAEVHARADDNKIRLLVWRGGAVE